MQEKHLKSIFTFKKTAVFGSGLGIILILLGQFASDYNTAYFLTALGFGILAGSVVNYLFGTFLSLMEEFTGRRKNGPKMATASKNYYILK
ncbi:MFS transporter [Neobacillus drentensis]|uniref:MFS transporter n=1 Tax=Neobacillus drentensis TaxID=220684 RepID=UPI002FFDBE45